MAGIESRTAASVPRKLSDTVGAKECEDLGY